MLNDRMQQLMNERVNMEFYAAYLYLSMVAYFESENLPGMASWMRSQVQEELFHGMKMFDYINERGGRVVLTQIDTPIAEWDSALDVFRAGFEHELKVTAAYNEILSAAREERDHASEIFLQWYVTEQVEEESNFDATIHQLERIGDSSNALLMFDREMGQRVFTPPAAESEA